MRFPDPDQLFNPLAQQFINPLVAVQRMPRREFPIEQDNSLFFPAGCDDSADAPVATNHRGHIQSIHTVPGELSVLVHRRRAVGPQRREGARRRPSPAADDRRRTQPVSVPWGTVCRQPGKRDRLLSSTGSGGGEGRRRRTSSILPDWNLDGDRGYGFSAGR